MTTNLPGSLLFQLLLEFSDALDELLITPLSVIAGGHYLCLRMSS